MNLKLFLAVTFTSSCWLHTAFSTVYVASGPTIQKGKTLWNNRRTSDGRFWEIPYKIDPTFGDDSNPDDAKYFDNLATVMDQYHDRTCLRFLRIPFDDEIVYPYISFQNKNGNCASRVGRCIKDNGKCVNQINLNNICRKRTMGTTHEIMHSLGWAHTLTRPDREDFITIHWEHVREIYKGCFKASKVKKFSSENFVSDDMTVDECRLYCIEHGQLIFGVQSPDKCFCVEAAWKSRTGKVDDSLCPSVCNDVDQPCGGKGEGNDGYYSVYNLKENYPIGKKDNGVGFPMDPLSVMMGGFMKASRYSETDEEYDEFPPMTFDNGTHIIRPDKRTELSESDIVMINQVYGCQPESQELLE